MCLRSLLPNLSSSYVHIFVTGLVLGKPVHGLRKSYYLHVGSLLSGSASASGVSGSCSEFSSARGSASASGSGVRQHQWHRSSKIMNLKMWEMPCLVRLCHWH